MDIKDIEDMLEKHRGSMIRVRTKDDETYYGIVEKVTNALAPHYVVVVSKKLRLLSRDISQVFGSDEE